MDYRERVSIIAVGVWQYEHMRSLNGPKLDIQNFKKIFIGDPHIALYAERQYKELLNPTSQELRDAITTYVHERSADNDILVFYFSGHGASIGAHDFAFCTVDSQFYPDENVIYPMTAVSFSEFLRTLWIRKVTPIIIIDACYSGQVGVSISDLVNEMKGDVQRNYASSYALFCSAPKDEEVRDNPNGDGGFFSNTFHNLVHSGVPDLGRRKPFVKLEDLYNPIRQLAEQSGIGPVPMLFIGETLPAIDLARNIAYRPLVYKLTFSLFLVLKVLWNEGNPLELQPKEILEVIIKNDWGGTGGFGNSTKLSRPPWALIEITAGRRRRLNDRGIAFMEGRLDVPLEVVDDGTGNYLSKPGTEQVKVNYFKRKRTSDGNQ